MVAITSKKMMPTVQQTIQVVNVVFQSRFSILETPPSVGFLQAGSSWACSLHMLMEDI